MRNTHFLLAFHFYRILSLLNPEAENPGYGQDLDMDPDSLL